MTKLTRPSTEVFRAPQFFMSRRELPSPSLVSRVLLILGFRELRGLLVPTTRVIPRWRGGDFCWMVDWRVLVGNVIFGRVGASAPCSILFAETVQP